MAAGAVAKGNGEGGAELQRQVFVATVAFGRRDGTRPGWPFWPAQVIGSLTWNLRDLHIVSEY